MGEEGQKKKKVLVEHNKADIRRGSDDEISLPILFLRFFFFFLFLFVKRIYLRLLRTGVSSFFFFSQTYYYSRTLRVCSFVCVRVCFFFPLYAPPLFSFFLFTASSVSFFCLFVFSFLANSLFLSVVVVQTRTPFPA